MKKLFNLCVLCLMAGTMFAQYVDLGLPSGTLWKSQNEDGYFVALRAKNLFDGQLPTTGQIEELRHNCVWHWKEDGFLIEGPNGNTIFLPAKGARTCEGKIHCEKLGCYWTSKIGESYSNRWNFGYGYGSRTSDVVCDLNCVGCCVRLVKKK